MSDESPRRPSVVVWALAGFLAAVVGGGLVAGGVSYALVQRRHHAVRAGWNLVPVTVAARDLPARHRIAAEDLSQRAVPEQFVTSSVVKPESASYLVGLTLLIPVRAGEALMWGEFPDPGAKCAARVEAAARSVEPSVSKAAWELVGAWKQRFPQRKDLP